MNNTWWVDPAELDDDQKKVLLLPMEGKHVVTGPPGSGKSNLLMLRARHLLKLDKQNFRVLAFTQTLVRFLCGSEKVPKEKVATSTAWLDRQLWQLEGRKIDEDDFDTRRRLVADALLKHLRDNNKSGLIHTLLIDEVQDYLRIELELFGEIAEHLLLVGDIRQQIYKSDTTHRDLKAMKGSFNVVELELHYRIGRNICLFADRLAKPSRDHKPITDGCQYNEVKNPSSVERERLSLDKQIERIAKRVKTQLQTFPGEFIGVLCPTNKVLDQVAEELTAELGKRVCVQKSGEQDYFDLKHPVVVSTIHSGKGLEYRCVHIPSAESLKFMPHSRELIYTAVTRAKTTVTIYHEEPLHDFLEDAINAGAPPPAPVSLDSLFK